MKNELTKLMELAKIDSEIDLLAEERGDLPRLITELEGTLKTLENSLGEKQKEIKTLKEEAHQKELSLKEQQEWIADRETRVKEIKTNKEYQAALKEVSKAKKDITDLEASLLQINTRTEEETKKIADTDAEAHAKKENLSKEIEEKKGQVALLAQQIEEKIIARAEREKDLAAPTLKRYKLIKTRLSPAVALASSNGVCQECNMNIPPQIFIELQKLKQIITCPRCHRILSIET